MILAIDPGTTQSAWVLYDPEARFVVRKAIEANEKVEDHLRWGGFNAVLVIEKIESQGMSVGAETFETVFWTGRFAAAWDTAAATKARRVTRREVKLHLCGSMRAKDGNIRQAVLDKFGGRGAIGTKKNPGPLHGMRSHLWSAMAVALTYCNQ